MWSPIRPFVVSAERLGGAEALALVCAHDPLPHSGPPVDVVPVGGPAGPYAHCPPSASASKPCMRPPPVGVPHHGGSAAAGVGCPGVGTRRDPALEVDMSSRRKLKGRRIAVLAADGFEKVEL